jgi:HemY protein
VKHWLWALLFALLGGALLGQLMLDDPGYVLVTWHEHVLESSLWIAAALVLVIVLALMALLGLFGAIMDAAETLRRWQQDRRGRRGRELTEAGLAQLAQGDWRKATSTLLKATALVDTPLLVQLASARAAEDDGRIDLAEQILADARGIAGDATALVDLALAELKLRRRDTRSARILLERLRSEQPRHPRILLLLREACEQEGAWLALGGLLPVLRKYMEEDAWLVLARNTWRNALQQAAREPGHPSRKSRIDAVQAVLRSVGNDLRDDPAVVLAHAEVLAGLDAGEEALETIEKALGKHWDDGLVALYARIEAPSPLEQLATAEKWLAMRPTNPVLLLALGRISLRNRLWGKARDYFEASIGREARAETCAELVRLYTRLGETGKVEHYLRRQAELVGSTLPELPLPGARV